MKKQVDIEKLKNEAQKSGVSVDEYIEKLQMIELYNNIAVIYKLNASQIEVIKGIYNELTPAEIADNMEISLAAFYKKRASVIHKLKVSSDVGIIKIINDFKLNL